MQALDESGEAKLLADPTITVGDRTEASIRIVQKIPIIAADPVENSGVVFSQVQFEEAGIILKVLPRISRDGTIDLKVNPEYSVVADFIENNPVIDSRTADTTVRVADGQMFVLGGLRQKTLVESIRGVPWLKDLKHVGKLFRAHDTEIRGERIDRLLASRDDHALRPGQRAAMRRGRRHGGTVGRHSSRRECPVHTLLPRSSLSEPSPEAANQRGKPRFADGRCLRVERDGVARRGIHRVGDSAGILPVGRSPNRSDAD